MISFIHIFIGTAILILFVGIWCGIAYLLAPGMKNPDGYAKVTGNCGDTMEIGLRIQDGMVVGTHTWTDGCSISKLCVEAAARLAHGQNLDTVEKINMVSVIDELGSLPETHLHCAQLAEITLRRALADYQRKTA